MGTRRGTYSEEFPAGSAVRIADFGTLDAFRRNWRRHHPLEDAQLAFAGRTAIVQKVSFYHGGDELYELDGVPGIWHEHCLRNVND